MKFASYTDFLNWLYNLKRFGMSYGVENIKKLLSLIGNPEEKINCVLITGSGGKGSTVSLISEILQRHGLKTGKFIKPHLHRYTERISINSEEISKERVLEIANFIIKKIEASDYHPTFFEFTTALSMLYFIEEGCDICVYEVGIGGRYDATNVLNPAVSALTTVYLEHTNILGNTLEEIAWNKVGIARKDRPFVLGYSGERVQRVVEEEMRKIGSVLITCSEMNGFDVRYEILKSDMKGNLFNYYGLDVELKDLYTPMLGFNIPKNFSVALAVIELLDMLGYDFNEEKIRRCLEEIKIKGRLEIFNHENKTIILDCAKDPTAMNSLADFLEKNFEDKFNVIISISSDKDYKSMLNSISKIAKSMIFSEHKVMSRAIKSRILNEYFLELNKGIPCYMIPDVKRALLFALENLEGPILVTGSVFTVAEAREALVNEEKDEIEVSDPLELRR